MAAKKGQRPGLEPDRCCGNCYFYQVRSPGSGDCYGAPPTPWPADDDSGIMSIRPPVEHNDPDCGTWKPKHNA